MIIIYLSFSHTVFEVLTCFFGNILFWLLQSSRLHFIGTWRNRYRKRFPISSKGFNKTESNRSASDSSTKTPIIHIDMVPSTPVLYCTF